MQQLSNFMHDKAYAYFTSGPLLMPRGVESGSTAQRCSSGGGGRVGQLGVAQPAVTQPHWQEDKQQA